MTGTVRQILPDQSTLVKVDVEATAADAAQLMSDNDVGCAVVIDHRGRLIGIISERDLLNKAAATVVNPRFLEAGDIMSRDIISCDIDSPISDAEQLMAEHRIRHLPVMQAGRCVAMLSSRDIIRYRLKRNEAMKAAAEEIARLTMNLKSVNFEEVVELIVRHVPDVIGADSAALWFADDAGDIFGRRVWRRGCNRAELGLADRQKLAGDFGQAGCGAAPPCDSCPADRRSDDTVLIQLSVSDFSADAEKEVTRQGFLCMCDIDPGREDSQQLMLYKASLLREILSANLTSASLYQNYRRARRQSEQDALTGLAARRALQEKLKTEYARAVRYRLRFCMAVIDVDNFKRINDSAGHIAGDRALLSLARVMQKTAREADVIGRYGGDEFVLLMPETGLEAAQVALERLREKAAGLHVTGGEDRITLSISCGLAQWSPDCGLSLKELFNCADGALYDAKGAGRNRVVAAKPAAIKAG